MTDSTPSPEVLPLSAALQIASYAGPVAGDKHHHVEYTQAEQRIRIINAWAPALGPGSRVLEIGCGQGTSTQALAEAVGEAGHIDAVDPGDPDYGGPLTLAQAQAHLSNGPIGKRITWHNADPVAFLGDQTDKTWDVAILAYSIWYFKSPQALREILEALKGRVNKVLVAEHGLHATNKEAIPHVLAAFARATLEAHRKNSDENIQNVMSPTAIKKVATAAGWVVEKEGIVVPDAGLSDGQWETGTVASESFLQTIEQSIEDERVKNVLISARDSVLSALAAIGGKVAKAQTMDTWVGTLVPV